MTPSAAHVRPRAPAQLKSSGDSASLWFPTKVEVVMALKLNSRLLDGVVVLDCAGRIVFGEETTALRDTVKGLLGETKQIVVNLGQVNYIDSGGLGTLVGLFSSARASGANIKLANLTQRVGDLLQITKLMTVFEVYEGEDMAVKAFRKANAAAK
jgi:anti-sigma B factor antagonist